jgi:heat shock protein HspQ
MVLEDGQSELLDDDARRWFTVDADGHHAPLDERLH